MSLEGDGRTATALLVFEMSPAALLWCIENVEQKANHVAILALVFFLYRWSDSH